jgi:predicted MFS family arabinose efflux permease
MAIGMGPGSLAKVLPNRGAALLRLTPRWALLAFDFAIGCGVMVTAGVLNDIVRSLQVSVALSGHFVGAAAVVMAFGSPRLAAMYQGQFGGAASGGALIAADGCSGLSWVALAWMTAALATSLWVARRMHRGLCV